MHSRSLQQRRAGSRVAGELRAGRLGPLLLVAAICGCDDSRGGVPPISEKTADGTLSVLEQITIRADSAVVLARGDTVAVVKDDQGVLWRKRFAGEKVIATRTALDSTVYVLTDKAAYGVSPGGEQLFRLEQVFGQDNLQPFGAYALLTTSDSRLVLSDGSASLVKISPQGQIQWRYRLEGQGLIAGVPVAGPNGTIYLRSRSFLFAVSPAGKLRWRVPLQNLFEI